MLMDCNKLPTIKPIPTPAVRQNGFIRGDFLQPEVTSMQPYVAKSTINRCYGPTYCFCWPVPVNDSSSISSSVLVQLRKANKKAKIGNVFRYIIFFIVFCYVLLKELFALFLEGYIKTKQKRSCSWIGKAIDTKGLDFTYR